MLEEILAYLQQQPRNKLIISREGLDGVNYFNVGAEVAEALIDLKSTKNFSLRAKSNISKIIENAKYDHRVLGRILPLENIGILLEPELKFNLVTFLETTTQDLVVVLKWPGVINNKRLFFLNPKKGVEIDLEHLSFLEL